MGTLLEMIISPTASLSFKMFKECMVEIVALASWAGVITDIAAES